MTDIQQAVQRALGERRAAYEARSHRLAWAEGVQTLYKLRSLVAESRAHTFDILENSRAYFAHPDQFNDPFDCYPQFALDGDLQDPAFRDLLLRDEERMAHEAGHSADEIAALRRREGVPLERLAEAIRSATTRAIRADTRILCLAREHRHPLMWSHYAASHTGVCIHFRCQKGVLFGYARRVLYPKERRPLLVPLSRQTDDVIEQRLVWEKADFWQYESEYRIVGHKTHDWGYEFDAHHRVSFAPELLLGITVGMRISPSDRADLTALARARNMEVWEAFESPKRFWLDVRRIS